MCLFLVWCHRLICNVLSLCKHACKDVCDVKLGIDPYPLLARSWNRWWPDFLPFAAWRKSRLGLKRSRKAQHVLNRCKELFKQKKYFGARCTLNEHEIKEKYKTPGRVKAMTLCTGVGYSANPMTKCLRTEDSWHHKPCNTSHFGQLAPLCSVVWCDCGRFSRT